MLDTIPRQRIDEVLFTVLQAIYKFQQDKIIDFNLDYEEIYLLQFLRRNTPARMGDIADEMIIPISTATRVVDRLQHMGMISRKKDPFDKRNVLVSLERKGERTVKKIEEHSYQILSENLKEFNDEDIMAFYKTAMNMKKILRVDDK